MVGSPSDWCVDGYADLVGDGVWELITTDVGEPRLVCFRGQLLANRTFDRTIDDCSGGHVVRSVAATPCISLVRSTGVKGQAVMEAYAARLEWNGYGRVFMAELGLNGRTGGWWNDCPAMTPGNHPEAPVFDRGVINGHPG